MKYNYLTTILLVLFFTSLQAQVSVKDSLILVELYHATDGPNWRNKSNWLTDSVYKWHGIRVENNRVTRIGLERNRLTGAIPDTISGLDSLEYLALSENDLNGELPGSIGNLMALRTLIIKSSGITGEIPQGIGGCKNLEVIIIDNNMLTGTLPDSMSALSKLNYFSASNNSFSGPFPPAILEMKKMRELDISSNDFYGPIPAAFDSLSKLTFVYLQNCKFSGPMPKIHNLTRLKEIDLTEQFLEGDLDTILGYHPELENLSANNNKFSGRISTEHYHAGAIRFLRLAGNAFTDMDDFQALAGAGNLMRFFVSNNFLDFDDLEPNVNLPIEIFQFNNQGKVGTIDTVYLRENENDTIISPMESSMVEYVWIKDGDTIPEVEGPHFYIMDFDSLQAGAYYFRSTHPDFPELVIERRPIYYVVDESTAVKERLNFDFEIFPNPVDQFVRITLPEQNRDVYELYIYDLSGTVVYSGEAQNGSRINVSDWLSGIYMAFVKDGNKTGVRKLLKL